MKIDVTDLINTNSNTSIKIALNKTLIPYLFPVIIIALILTTTIYKYLVLNRNYKENNIVLFNGHFETLLYARSSSLVNIVRNHLLHVTVKDSLDTIKIPGHIVSSNLKYLDTINYSIDNLPNTNRNILYQNNINHYGIYYKLHNFFNYFQKNRKYGITKMRE